MKCPSCNAQIDDNRRECPFCHKNTSEPKLPERLVTLNKKLIDVISRFVADNQVSEVELYPIMKGLTDVAYQAMIGEIFKPKPIPLLAPTPDFCNTVFKPQGSTIDHICKLPWKHDGEHFCDECKKVFVQIEQEAREALITYKSKHSPLPQAKEGERYATVTQLAKIYALPNDAVERYCEYHKKTDPSWLTKAEAERLIKESR